MNESKAKEVILNDQLANLNAMVASIQNQREEKKSPEEMHVWAQRDNVRSNM